MPPNPETAEGQRIAKLEEALGSVPGPLWDPDDPDESTAAKTDKSLSENSSEKAQLYQVGDKEGGKPPRVLMDLPLFYRRKQMLITGYSGRLNPRSLKQLSVDFVCPEKTLLNDWADRENWEPFIWGNQVAHEDGKYLLYQLQLAREEAVYLMKTATNDSARVGAIGKVIDSVKVEVELNQSLGFLPRVKMEPNLKVEFDVTNQTAVSVTVVGKLLKQYQEFVRESEKASVIRVDGVATEQSVSKADADGQAKSIS